MRKIRRPWAWLAVVLLAALAGALGPPGRPAEAGGRNEVHVFVRDSIFNPAIIRIPEGGTVIFHFEGRNPHTVTAEDGSFDSGFLERGATFKVTLDKAGRYPFYCKPHGYPGGRGMSGIIWVGYVADESYDTGNVRTEPRPGGPATVRVPDDYPTVQAAVDAAYPDDLVLIGPGEYFESVVVMTPRLTIRGTDRNKVVFDGHFQLDNAFKVLGADGVVLENMTARHYTLNGFYWTGVKGYRGSYLTAYNNGDYGIYAFDSQYGQFDRSYASGNPDSGFYIGQCKPCHALITNIISENNGLGYSGTNAGGDLTLANSLWRNNFAGIAPNTLDTEHLAPQMGSRIINNIVVNNGNQGAPTKAVAYPAYGVGIVVAGGNQNVVEGNLVLNNASYGILVAPNMDQRFWLSSGNTVRENRVAGSGKADLVIAAPAGQGNRFADNDARTALPAQIERVYGGRSPLVKLGGGELSVTFAMLARVARLEMGLDYTTGDWQKQPAPPPQPNMPDPMARPAPAWPTPESEALKDLKAAVPAYEGAAAQTSLLNGGVLPMGPWWVMGFGLYVYLLPFMLYTCWVTVAVWDLMRRDDRSMSFKLGWLAAVLLLPLVGPVAYYAAGRSAIPGLLRWGLIGGGSVLYVALALAMVWLAPA